MKIRLRKFKPDGKRDVNTRGLFIHAMTLQNCTGASLTFETDESYELKMETPMSVAYVRIKAKNYFGLRHGLETLEQLMFFNDITRQIQMPSGAIVIDGPSYPHRGVMLDTSRNFLDKFTIKRTIVGMGMSKLNTLHWHMTDQHSFPYFSRTWPNMTRFGAYSPSKVYTAEDIKEIKDFGIYHGVRVIPELDAPAHVGEGWQWIDDALICYRDISWTNNCPAPPCGQLNPLNEKVYEVLEGLYKDLLKDFDPDVFHLGGDQVNKNCWQSSQAIRRWANSTDLNLQNKMFFKLWNNFQARAYQKLKAANGGKDKQAILWTSGEVILWSESADKNSLDVQLWPRAVALAGRLWNDDISSSRNAWRDVESRMFLHRDRLVDRGILAQTMAPEWCHQNLGLCRLPIEILVGEDSRYTIFPD
ncbi:hypothetical protein G9C98_001679 [Cotesia typhae]|uniref:beta-N-acetylhexosaminidase n=1 Tax=Cotesia typhae TaxID=2053667 RepID=A0A8J5R1W1_9HYME|nr:hypothetical protein G9C98_001679 [Cotesia typhae]